MSFLAGFLFILLLIMVAVLVLFLAKFVPKEMFFVPLIFMIGLDTVLVFAYYQIILETLVVDEATFRIGLATAFALSAFGRAFYLMIRTVNEEKASKLNLK